MSKENLQNKTCKELRDLAKELKIVGRWDMAKEQLIDAILGAKDVEIDKTNASKSAKDECKVDNQMAEDAEVEDKVEKESASTTPAPTIEIDMERKLQYVKNAETGTLVAFKLSNGKVKSAKITNKSMKNHKLKLETEYGAVYIVSYEDIIWVRTGLRWPRGVYKLLKGIDNENGKEKA